MEINLNLSVEEVNCVLAGLSELPAKHSYDVINKVKVQAESQVNTTTGPAKQQLLIE